MTRLLFWIGLAVLVYMALRSRFRSVSGPAQQGGKPAAPPPAEAMACCAHCHIYFPASEAVRADGLDYCCPAHVRQPPR
ncbi:MAG TPA: PP0621 family protein [Telluria sp.]|nr:PP0621 family protein [Telluria sp.]